MRAKWVRQQPGERELTRARERQVGHRLTSTENPNGLLLTDHLAGVSNEGLKVRVKRIADHQRQTSVLAPPGPDLSRVRTGQLLSAVRNRRRFRTRPHQCRTQSRRANAEAAQLESKAKQIGVKVA
jgi:hypothetical protein